MPKNGNDGGKKVAIVAGSCTSIGQAIAREFVNEGHYHVIINGSDEKILNQTSKEISKAVSNKHDKDIVPFAGDVSEEQVSKALINEAIQKFGRIDVLVNNAEVLYNPQRLNRIGNHSSNIMQQTTPYFTLEEYEFTDESLSGTYLCSKEAAKWWSSDDNKDRDTDSKRKKNYSIINVAHCYNSMPESAEDAFTFSKSGVDLFTYSKENTRAITKTIALALLDKGIRVNGIMPGIIATESRKYNDGKERRKKNEQLILRVGQPEDVAKVATFLASDNASYITGSIIYVDGGLSLSRPTRYLEQDLERY